MESYQQPVEMIDATVEQVAAWLSAAEGRKVTVQEVRQIEMAALRKLRQLLRELNLSSTDLLP